MESDVCIIGAGPAGLMAAIFAAESGAKTIVFETNTTAGRKLLLTGGGRCNITHDRSIGDFVRAFGEKYRFVQHCLYEFSPQDLRKFLADRELPTKVQQDGCVFPVTERSSDVKDILFAEAKGRGVVFIYGSRIEIIYKSDRFFTISSGKETFFSKKVIIATGGLSYPKTGSTGDGYRFAQKFGHTIIEPKPALVPLITKEDWPGRLAGTTIENVKIAAKIDNKKIISAGAMLFTQDGIGGPAVLDLSRLIADSLSTNEKSIPVSIDTMANTNEAELERRFLKLCEENSKKTIKGILSLLYPQRFAACFCEEFNFDDSKIARQLEKSERKKLIKLLKTLPLTVTAARPIEEATITHGGVCTEEIDSKTMESKICPGLYFAGEVIDIDGPCGGFNLQFAFSSGALAGKSAAESIIESK
jgi:predicted Rossmann fold flavoprotein